MPERLKRFHQSEQSHFITFSCYHRRPLFQTDESKATFETALERIRHKFELRIYAYVVMPEHVHLLVGEPEQGILADALKSRPLHTNNSQRTSQNLEIRSLLLTMTYR
jgi:putative transposase